MKTISLREFQLHPTDYLTEPVVLTRYNKRVVVVFPADYADVLLETPKENVLTDVLTDREVGEKESVEITGWCQLHFEKGKGFPLKEITWEDENGVVIIDKKLACPSCILKYENMGKGRVYYG